MIPWVRIILYFCIFSLVIVKLKNKSTPLTPLECCLAYAWKIMLGCLYGYIHLRYYKGDDTWVYNRDALIVYEQLKTNPLDFFAALWPAYIDNFAEVKYFISNNLEQEILTRLIAIGNLVTGGNYYLNVVVFNFFLFWGHYWLYKCFVTRYPEKRTLLFAIMFFIPPMVFWLSGIRGDGLVFLFLGLLFFLFAQWLSDRKASRLIYCILAMLGICIFRSPVLLVLIPFLAGWFISSQFRIKPLVSYGFVYLFCCVVFFGSLALHPQKNLPMLVAAKQQAFMELPGKTKFAMEPLKPQLSSFLKAAPLAMLNTLVRPYIWEARGVLQLVTAVETTTYLLLIIALIPFVTWGRLGGDPFLSGVILFSLSLFLFIGLTIPFPGAIIRYKAIPELLLLLGLIISADRIIIKQIRFKT